MVNPLSNSRTIRIGLMGAHSGGKTTAWYDLAAMLKKARYTVDTVPESATQAADAGWPLDRLASAKTQFWIVAQQMKNELEAMRHGRDFMILDRTVFDGLAYGASNDKISNTEYQLLAFIANMWTEIYPYDLLIYFPPRDEPPQADGVRDTDIDWQRKIHIEFLRLTTTLGLPIYICQAGDREERSLEVVNEVKKRFMRK